MNLHGLKLSVAVILGFMILSFPATASDLEEHDGDAGEVTIALEGAGVYYLGEEITISGTNTASDTTYLFLTGPGLGNGVPLDDPALKASEGNYLLCTVAPSHRWAYRWDTSVLSMKGGVPRGGNYLMHAVSAPENGDGAVHKDNLEGVRTVRYSFVLNLPQVTLDEIDPQSAGDNVRVSGVADGRLENVTLWAFGDHTVRSVTVPVPRSGIFAYTLTGISARDLAEGRGMVIVQHPGADQVYGVCPVAGGDTISQIRGADREVIDLDPDDMPGAAATLTRALNSASCDDVYQRLAAVRTVASTRPDPLEPVDETPDVVSLSPTPRPAHRGTLEDEEAANARLSVSNAGEVEASAALQTRDVSLSLDAGGTALNIFGRPLEMIDIRQVSSDTLPPTGKDGFRQVGPVLECGPNGASFDPAVELCFTLTDEEWETCGPGEEFVVRWYCAESGDWEEVRTGVDRSHRQVVASVTHFTTFAVFAGPPSEETPMETPSPEMTTPALSTDVPPSSGRMPWLSVAGGGAALLMAGVLFAFRKER
ncbi:hypothetical protein J2129_001837 [Methanofollis sp. W23]|uniref:hypothetical protein n=1 Tax=Methanofollis sp. W23 TaxID=2817849 RepID=UPI001AE6C0A4|nr:hypothetical protein [Methanofollis sp. W23]MBP2146383.1 hypothetical protein [Methanofollis sp. W23]